MVDDFRELAGRKIAPPALTPLKNEYRAQVALAEATTRLGAARAYQNSSLSSIWQTVSRGETPTAAQRAAVGMMAIHGLQEALKVGEIVCEAAGSVGQTLQDRVAPPLDMPSELHALPPRESHRLHAGIGCQTVLRTGRSRSLGSA
jgi:hypothetical protein